MTGRYLEDFAVGQTFHSGRLQIDKGRIKTFGAEFDPQPFHLDEEAARDMIFGGLAASGWHTATVTMRLLVERDLKPAVPSAWLPATGDVADLTRLVRVTMHLRPDRIIVGEVRGGEALALLKAWNTGHPGGITTVHANSAAAALLRLDSLIQESGVPPQPRLVAETVDLVVFIVRTPEGRRVRELAQVNAYDAALGTYVLEAICDASKEVEHA